MEANQIKLLKDMHMKPVEVNGKQVTAGGYMRFCLDGGIDFVTSKDFVIFDDANNMLHCIAINEDGKSQADYPIKFISTDYGIIQQVESIYGQKNFEDMLKDSALKDIAGEERCSKLLAWSRSIHNQAIQPSRPTPYYSMMPAVIPAGSTSMPRNDGIEYPAENNGMPAPIKTATTNEDLAEMIENAPAGSMIMVGKNVTFDEATTIEGNDITLISEGAPVTAPITVKGNGVTLQGFNFYNKSDADDAKTGGTCLKAEGNDLTLKGCIFEPDGKTRDAIVVSGGGDIVIENCSFLGNDEKLYNVIELGQADDQKIKSLRISGCYFDKGCSINNSISIYQFENNATVEISQNTFEWSGNAIRVSNYSNATGVNITCVDNTYKNTDVGEYAGFMLFQGVKDEDFSTMNVKFIRLTGPNGKKMTENGVGQNQVWYTYNTETNPVVSFY